MCRIDRVTLGFTFYCVYHTEYNVQRVRICKTNTNSSQKQNWVKIIAIIRLLSVYQISFGNTGYTFY